VASETKQARSQAEAVYKHLGQGSCLSGYTLLHPDQTGMEEHPAGHHLDYRYSMPREGRQV
jgi:hypothetical protein